MADSTSTRRRESVSTGLLWFSRITGWLCGVGIVATVAFGLRMKAQGRHGELYLDFGLSNTTLLVLIFAATVTIIASVMAHAARVADENEQFV